MMMPPPRALLPLALILVLTGCRRESVDLNTTLSESRGLRAEAPVLWKGQVVGDVLTVAPGTGGVRVEIDLNPDYEGYFHHGLAASAVGDASQPERTTLNLYGGTDVQQEKLPAGVSIPEALPHQKVDRNQAIWVVAAVAGIVVVVLLIKSIGFMVKLAVALLLVAGSFFYLKVVLERHGQDLVPESVAAKVDQFLATHEVPEHLDAWLADVKEDARAVADEAANLGKEQGNVFVDEVLRRTREKIKEMGENTEAGRELRGFQEELQRF